jgi:hypothetical protein
MSTASTPPSGSAHVADEKVSTPDHVEHIATHDQVPGHDNYYEKNGLRTYGDGEDHDHEPPVSEVPVENSAALCSHELDVIQEINVSYRHGLHLDWVSNTCLHLRSHPSLHLL